MIKLQKCLLMLSFIVGLSLASCSDDDEKTYNNVDVNNAELKALLQQRGFNFDQTGKLIRDEKVLNTKILDLSGTKISNLSGLDVFPNLEEVNLSNNGYGKSFDFSVLPSTVKGVDLTGNVIYDYEGLVDVKIAENGDETVTNLRNLNKLYLPVQAKYNIEVLARYYRANKAAIENGTLDMKMANAGGILQKYTTLRVVPDEYLRKYLKEKFSSLFNGDQIDISRQISGMQKTNSITIEQFGDGSDMDKISNLEGLEYIIQHPSWNGVEISVIMSEDKTIRFPYIHINASVWILSLVNVVTMPDGIDLSKAKKFVNLYLQGIQGLESVDISTSTLYGQRGAEAEGRIGDGESSSTLRIINCPSLKEIKVPKVKDLCVPKLALEALPSLETFDMSNYIMINWFVLGNVSKKFNLVYPNLTIHDDGYGDLMTSFGCSKSTYDRKTTRDFIDKYYTNADPVVLSSISSFYFDFDEAYDWERPGYN